MQPLTAEEVSKTLKLIADSDALSENTMMQSVLIVASSHIDELVKAKNEAESLAMRLFIKHFSDEDCYKSGRVKFELCDSVAGVISQIDNMSTSMTNRKKYSRDDFEKWYSYRYGAPFSALKKLRDGSGYGDEHIRLNFSFDAFMEWAGK